VRLHCGFLRIDPKIRRVTVLQESIACLLAAVIIGFAQNLRRQG
jgi:hypothetical protein